MAAKKTPASQSKPNTKSQKKKTIERNCWKGTKHTPHVHVTYAFTNSGQPAQCDGTGKTPAPTSYKPKVKKDYSQDPENFPVSNPITLSQAQKIAFHMHREQKDKSGKPYNGHLHAVRMGVTVLGGTVEEQIAALFHDAVEDGHTSYDLLRKINLTEQTIVMIEAVSKRTSEEQGKYLQRIIEAGPGAMRVKLADLLHNTRHDRLADLPEHTRTRLLKKYRPAMARLMLELGMIATEETQAKLATKPVGSAGGSYWHGSGGKQKAADGSQTWSQNSIIGGEWIAGTPAPVDKKLGKPAKGEGTEYLLTDGSRYVAKGDQKVWSKHEWEKRMKADPTWSPANPEPEKSDSENENDETWQTWDADSVFPGDWIEGQSAPVLERDHVEGKHVEFLLCDGQVLTYSADERVTVMPKSVWSVSTAVQVPAPEEDVTDFIDMLAKSDETEPYAWDSGKLW